jgi:hypothetical protein
MAKFGRPAGWCESAGGDSIAERGDRRRTLTGYNYFPHPHVFVGMASEDDNRKRGVEFGSLADDLESEAYPIDNEELLETYGDRELELQDGTQSLREVLELLGERTFDSAEEVTDAVVGMVGDDAIGRKYESDRGGMADEGTDESV